jgi:hypothetical protein
LEATSPGNTQKWDKQKEKWSVWIKLLAGYQHKLKLNRKSWQENKVYT